MKQPKLDATLGFISGSSLSVFFMHSVVNLFKDDQEHRFGADMMIVHGPYVHDNRNRLEEQFLGTGRSWLFMVDNDMVFEPKDVWELFKVADEHGPGIYSAPYQLESATMVCGAWDADVELAYHPLLKLPDKPQEIGVVGAGFTLVHREVFQKIGLYAFTAQKPYVGEDLAFCWRVREAGYTPVLVPACNPGHAKHVVLFPHGSARNAVGDDVNLVELSLKEA